MRSSLSLRERVRVRVPMGLALAQASATVVHLKALTPTLSREERGYKPYRTSVPSWHLAG
jgi:hypothetical protein